MIPWKTSPWPTVAALGLAALGCSLLTPRPTPVPEVDSALAAFGDPQADPEAAFLDLSRAMSDDPAGVEATALGRLDDPHPEVRLIAIYSLAETASTPAGLRALHDLLDADDATERSLAAEGLLRRGEPEAIPALIDVLDEDSALRGAEPPSQVWEFARDLLLRYTDQDFGLSTAEDSAAVAAAKPAWEAWWGTSSARVAWDDEALLFRSAP